MTTTPIFSTTVESMPVTVYNNNTEVGLAAAADAAEYLKQVLQERGHANVILATGNSQLTFLHTLRAKPRHRLEQNQISSTWMSTSTCQPVTRPVFRFSAAPFSGSPAAGSWRVLPGSRPAHQSWRTTREMYPG